MNVTLHHGDCLDVLRGMADNSVDSVVTDPPYGIRFMGKAWDGADIEARVADRQAKASHSPCTGPNGGHKSIAAEAGKYDTSLTANQAFQVWTRDWAAEALRVLKPGGYLLSFASTRTYHRMASGVEDAGFEIRDQIGWMFGSGFPKSHNGPWGGTALKPAWEPIVVARKPLIGTVEANWHAYGTGALNIDGCRVLIEGEQRQAITGKGGIPARHTEDAARDGGVVAQPHALGRWPANLIHDGSDEVLAGFPDSNGSGPERILNRSVKPDQNGWGMSTISADATALRDAGTGSAARFFYCAKASKEDRDEGLHGFALQAAGIKNESGRGFSESDPMRQILRANNHPTVKPTDLMAYLCRLVTPADGTVLDPFMGSGSTGKAAVLEGFSFIGIEREAPYLEIARARIDHARRQGFQPSLELEAA